MKIKLRESVADYRYRHSLLVAEIAAELAANLHMDAQKVIIAGLLHDCAKGFTDDPEIPLTLAAEAGMIPTAIQLSDPVLFLHAPLSAYIAKRDYGIVDDEILNAISRHTSGYVGMSNLDELIYLSDYIEPTRKGMDKYREIAKRDPSEAFYQLYTDNMMRIISNEWVLDENASAIYNSINLKRKRRRVIADKNAEFREL
jgi:predicted HD superfamily hydrolase involved in NAD metabolism